MTNIFIALYLETNDDIPQLVTSKIPTKLRCKIFMYHSLPRDRRVRSSWADTYFVRVRLEVTKLFFRWRNLKTSWTIPSSLFLVWCGPSKGNIEWQHSISIRAKKLRLKCVLSFYVIMMTLTAWVSNIKTYYQFD